MNTQRIGGVVLLVVGVVLLIVGLKFLACVVEVFIVTFPFLECLERFPCREAGFLVLTRGDGDYLLFDILWVPWRNSVSASFF